MGSTPVFKAKVCLIGEAAVGKTSLIRRYVEDAFDDRYISTFGAKVSLKRIWLTAKDDRSKIVAVHLSLWDLIGERSYLDSLHQDYLEGAQGLIAVCDLSRYSTFEVLDQWIPAGLAVAGDVPVALVVNKVDLRNEVVWFYDEDELRDRAQRYNGFVIWASAKTGENVNPIFGQLAMDIVRQSEAPIFG